MNERYVSRRDLPSLLLWKKLADKRSAVSFDFEATARCNLNCRHCYINVPAGDRAAKRSELGVAEIERIGAEAAALGAVWCLITGGEPLLREDFSRLYLSLKRRGLLVSVYTNATLVGPDIIRLFKDYPPRDVEVSVYGVTAATYERVTRVPGSFAAFMRGLDLLLASGVNVRLKAMALRSNLDEFPAVADFCRARTKDFFRFDPYLHYRFDRNPVRNAEIEAERLEPDEVAALDRADAERFLVLEKNCSRLIVPGFAESEDRHLFRCDAGQNYFVVGPEGLFRPCASLYHPDFLFDLKKGSLTEAWTSFTPAVLAVESNRKEYLERCARCPLINLCLWCPAHAYLETGELDRPIDKYCQIAKKRAQAFDKS